MNRFRLLGLGAALFAGSIGGTSLARQTSSDVAPGGPGADASSQPVTSLPAIEAPPTPAPPMPGLIEEDGKTRIRPLMEGPLHEAFLSPAKDRDARRIEATPPAPIKERPGVDPPDARAQWIDGYWEWDPGRSDFTWVTGTWRVAPPGRFWVNGYWKRDGQGWYRVPGFWSDRRTDRVDYRKNGPSEDRPDDEAGEAPDDDCFYIPGQYHPDGDGVVWKKGFWARAQPGWSWVPSQWVRQPEGWVFQDGYWDRTLEKRGTLFAPASVDRKDQASPTDADLIYQPYTQISPELYGQLNGAFGRPNSNYDGYPGVAYDETGRYYGYAGYGNIGNYYGYLDYPFYGGYGYPYYATPVSWGVGVGLGSPYAGYGYGLCGGTLGGLFGFGYGASPFAFGIGLGYPGYGFGGFGYPNNGYGYGGFGNAAYSYGGYGYGGLGFGYGGFGYGGFGLGLGLGFGYPWFGGYGFGYPWWGGYGWGGYGWGGHGGGGYGWRHRYPYHPGRHPGQHPGMHGGHPGNGGHRGPNSGHLAGMGHRPNGGAVAGHGHYGVQAPPSSRPFGNPFHHNGTAGQGVGQHSASHSRANVNRASSVANSGNGWHSAHNGAHQAASTRIQHSAARPAFSHTQNAAGNGHPGLAGANHLGGNAVQRNGALAGQPGQQTAQARQHAGAGLQGGHAGAGHQGSAAMGNVVNQTNRMGGMGGAHHPGAYAGAHGAGALGSGFSGAGNHVGGAHVGGFSAGHMGGSFGGGGHMGGGFGGAGHMSGGFGGGGHMGGGHGGGGHR